jgi:hypothetical protein
MYQSTQYRNPETCNLDVYSCGNNNFYIKIKLLTSQNKEQSKRFVKQYKKDPNSHTNVAVSWTATAGNSKDVAI